MCIIILLLLLFNFVDGLCPNGSTEWNSNCYFFQTNASEFATAEIACKSLLGNLVSVHDAFTNALLAGEATNYFQQSTEIDFWIGGTLLMNAGNWSWMDNSAFDFTDWATKEPQNATGVGCIAVSITTGAWSSQDCFKAKPYVCEVSATTPAPTYPPYLNCSIGWAYFQPTGSCYGLEFAKPGKLSWTAAEEYCEKYKAHLVSIHSYDEYKFVETYDAFAWDGVIWVGLRSDDGGITWTWSDKTPYDFPFWKDGINTTQSGCAVSAYDKLRISNCNDNNLFLCKKSALQI
jgi:hypothetical protein